MARTLTNEDVALVVGALDTLAVALTDYGHRWTDGERAVYEQAQGALGVPMDEDQPDECQH